MGEGEDVGVREEMGVVDRGAVVDGLVEGFFFVGDLGVVDVYEAVGGAGEEEVRVCGVELELCFLSGG